MAEPLIEAARAQATRMRAEVLRVLVPRLAGALDARRIWLFGSVARGMPSEDSDVDLLVEVGGRLAALPFKARLRIAYDAVVDAEPSHGCDVVPLSSEEIARKIASGNPFFREVWAAKELLYEHRSPA
ncbi:MAG: nucleotidyltransferase domain-containing protein [Betaproteobacteria bacterium]|nr:nucleotidyltransferase domain-containing protein [Betaproteobacteria bacterium]